MAITVRVPSSLREWFEGEDEACCCGATLAECIAELDSRFPGLKARILDVKGDLSSVFIFLNGENVRHLGGLATAVTDGDEIGIIPLAAGG